MADDTTTGTLHAGVLATVVDTAMGQAVPTGDDDVPATSQLTVTYLRPGAPGQPHPRPPHPPARRGTIGA